MADNNNLDDEEQPTQEFPEDDEDEPEHEEQCTQDFPEDDDAAESTAPSLVLAVDTHVLTALVPRYTMPMPDAGSNIVIAGRTTLQQAQEPTFLTSQVLGEPPAKVTGVFRLQDNTRSQVTGDGLPMQPASRIHSLLRVTRMPEGNCRLEIRDSVSIRQQNRHTRVLRGGWNQSTVKNDTWYELHHDDIVHFCPNEMVELSMPWREHEGFKYRVDIPEPQPQVDSDPFDSQPRMCKFVLPGQSIGRVIGRKGEALKRIREKSGECVIYIANGVYPGMQQQEGRAFYVSTMTEIRRPMTAILDQAQLPATVGMHMVIPTALLHLVLGSDGRGVERMQSRLAAHNVKLSLITATTPPDERLLRCCSNTEGILAFTDAIVTLFGPITQEVYAPLNPARNRHKAQKEPAEDSDLLGTARQGPGPGHGQGRGASTAADRTGGRTAPLRLTSKAARDKASKKGDRHASNKLKKHIQKQGRKARASLRGHK